jgi:hypothetical protein
MEPRLSCPRSFLSSSDDNAFIILVELNYFNNWGWADEKKIQNIFCLLFELSEFRGKHFTERRFYLQKTCNKFFLIPKLCIFDELSSHKFFRPPRSIFSHPQF